MRWYGRIWNKWHVWFAWYPVKVDDDQWVWLEYVERYRYRSQYSFYGYSTEYKYKFIP